MCEVNSCCCLSLRQGCIIIGGITILVSLIQTLIFSWVLVETYQSYQSSLNYQSSMDTNSSMDDSSASTYTFDSLKCPFGFLAISTKTSNESEQEGYQDNTDTQEDDEGTTDLVELKGPATPETPSASSARLTAQQESPLALGLTLEDEEDSSPTSSAPLVTLASPKEVAEGKGSQSPLSSSIMPLSVSPSSTSPSGVDNGTIILVAASSSVSAAAASFEPMYASSSTSIRTINGTRTRVKCTAQGQGVLWALVVASALYTLVGILLIFAILYCVSWQLSIWFFYTVGYNLLTLIVALMDGNYTSPPDISSYVVCGVMMYCVSVVDSYYEKQLLHDERADKNGSGRRRSSVVIVRSSPDTPTATQPEYIPPTSYRVNPGQSLAPPSAHNLAPPPPAHMLAPLPQKVAHPTRLTPPPVKKPGSPQDRGRENHHHKYHNNL